MPTKEMRCDQAMPASHQHTATKRDHGQGVRGECVACADHQSGDPAPVPTTGACTEVQRDATVQFPVGMETQHATILRINEDAAVRF